MAKKINLKAEKAKRNQAYALQFKKRKHKARPRAEAPASGALNHALGLAPSPSANAGPRPDGHPAVCDGCGVPTTLPFKPVQGKPVFCRPCFDKAS